MQPDCQQHVKKSAALKVGMPLPLSVNQARDYIYRPDVLAQWFGGGAVLPVKLNGSTQLPVDMGALWNGTVVQINVTAELHEITMKKAFEKRATETVSLRITARPGHESRISVSLKGFPEDTHGSRIRLHNLQTALLRLSRMVTAGMRRRPRQALIVIHGMGEQLPGETLNEFTRSLFPSTSHKRHVKPDYASSLFETRKITVNATKDGNTPTTDVYELYWAHLMRGTTFGQVAAWALRLLFTRPSKITARLRPHIWVIRGFFLIGVFLWITFLVQRPEQESETPNGPAVFAVLYTSLAVVLVAGAWRWIKANYIVEVLGDVPHYLEPKPANIEKRQAIREAGVDLLESLHASGRYDKIVILGHSLGSVIAYDILTFTWIRIGRAHRSPGTTRGRALRALENNLQVPPEEAQNLQNQAWKEYRRNGMPWLVTDFVTVGSPLTHAHLLLDRKKATFGMLKESRIFPTCPPLTEAGGGSRGEVFSYPRGFRDLSTGQRRTVLVPNHAALFALTRWTNLYFPFTGILRGDPVGGPLSKCFGGWIRDLELTNPGPSSLWGLTHTLYWKEAEAAENKHIQVLREALHLEDAVELAKLSKTLPLYEQQTRATSV